MSPTPRAWSPDQYQERTQLVLLPQHHEQLVSSAIAIDVAAERGYSSATTKAELARLGFSSIQQCAPALVLPIRTLDGEIAFNQARPDEPRSASDGRSIKYETPKGASMRLDVHPRMRTFLGDPERPLVITEGIKKVDAATTAELCCIGLLGVANWRGRNADGGLTALGDWEHVHLRSRRVVVVFDSDVMQKVPVYLQLLRLRTFLEQKGSEVLVVYLPSGLGGKKVGLDDYLADGKSRDELLALATRQVRHPDSQEPGATVWELGEYRMRPDGIWRRDQMGESRKIADFAARIRRKVIEDDGLEQRLRYDIQVQQGERMAVHTVPSTEFEAMRWPRQVMLLDPWIAAGSNNRDHVRSAVDLASKGVTRAVVYTHTGWRRLGDGKWVFLHAGGATGEVGQQDGVEVELLDALARFRLPQPPADENERQAILASLAVVDDRAVPDVLSIPILAAVYRAPLGSVDFSIFLVGESGIGKTELATLGQQHYGAELDSRHLPPSLHTSTLNSILGFTFSAQDAYLLIDEFKPSGNRYQRQQQHADMAKLLTALGNRQGRGRASTDGTPRPLREPRCLAVLTGEEKPEGFSTRARVLVLEIGRGEVDGLRSSDRAEHQWLDACQRAAGDGAYARSMAGYVSWLAPRIEAIRKQVRGRVIELRRTVRADHSRTGTNVAELMAGFEVFLDYAVERSAVSAPDRDAWRARAWEALCEVARRQDSHQAENRPERRFLELLGSAIASGQAHVAGRDGEQPADQDAWGWRQRIVGVSEIDVRWEPQGARVGWLDGTDLYLDPAASVRAANLMDPDSGIGVGRETLGKRLKESRLLTTAHEKDGRLTVQPRLEGRSIRVWRLRTHVLRSQDGPQVHKTGGTGGTGGGEDAASSDPPSAPPVSAPGFASGGGQTGGENRGQSMPSQFGGGLGAPGTPGVPGFWREGQPEEEQGPPTDGGRPPSAGSGNGQLHRLEPGSADRSDRQIEEL